MSEVKEPREWLINSLDDDDDGPSVFIHGPDAHRVTVIEKSAYDAKVKECEDWEKAAISVEKKISETVKKAEGFFLSIDLLKIDLLKKERDELKQQLRDYEHECETIQEMKAEVETYQSVIITTRNKATETINQWREQAMKLRYALLYDIGPTRDVKDWHKKTVIEAFDEFVKSKGCE